MFDPEFEPSIQYLLITVIAPGFLALLYMPVFVYFPLEFIVSQTPFQVRGLALGLLFVLFFLSPTISGWILSAFRDFQIASGSPYCVFYYYLVSSIFSLIFLLSYVHFANNYKLRIRDDIVPIHRLAEEYFEKEEKLRTKYWRQMELASCRRT